MEWGFDNARAVVGALLIIGLVWALSENRRVFPWRLALGAMAVQAALVLLLFGVPGSRVVLDAINGGVDALAAAAASGTQFVFGYLGGGSLPYAPADPNAPPPFIFAFQVLPLILVISTLSALLWHWGILKAVVRGFGLVFEKSMGLGGASALATAANIFMGMVESPIVIKGYLDRLSRSELFLMMVVGLATVAGSTMVAYATILAPSLPNAAGHVLVASIVTAPAGILLARIMIPEKADGPSGGIDYASALTYESSMDAITKGVQDGMMVIVNVGAFLLVFVSFVAIGNAVLGAFPDVGGEALTLQRIFGFIFAPLAWIIGVPWAEAQTAGGLFGTKLFLTEFVAFIELGAVPAEALDERSRMIMTYALCGFANVGSVGIMTGGMTVLMPQRRTEILSLAWKALIPGFLATCLSATIVAALPGAVFG